MDIAELIAYDSCFTDGGVDVRVGMPVDPKVDAAVCNGIA